MSNPNSNINRHYYIAGYDITNYVTQKESILGIQKKPEWGALPEIPRLEFIVSNASGLFSSLGELGMFRGETLTNLPLQVKYQQGASNVIEWEGVIETAPEDYNGNITTITGISLFSKFLDTPAETPSNLIDNPAELSRNLFTLFNIPVDDVSYNFASNYLAGLVTCQLDPNIGTSNVTLMDCQKKLAEAGFARMFVVNGKIHFEVFGSIRPVVSYDVPETFVMGLPKLQKEEKLPTGFRVDYINGFSLSSNYGAYVTTKITTQQLDYTANAIVKVADLVSAQTIADRWAAIYNENRILIDFPLDRDIASILDLTSFITLTWKKGGFNTTILEMMSFNRVDPRFVQVEGRTIS